MDSSHVIALLSTLLEWLVAGDGGRRARRRTGVEIRRLERDRGRLTVHQEHRLWGGRRRRRRRRRRRLNASSWPSTPPVKEHSSHSSHRIWLNFIWTECADWSHWVVRCEATRFAVVATNHSAFSSNEIRSDETRRDEWREHSLRQLDS